MPKTDYYLNFVSYQSKYVQVLKTGYIEEKSLIVLFDALNYPVDDILDFTKILLISNITKFIMDQFRILSDLQHYIIDNQYFALDFSHLQVIHFCPKYHSFIDVSLLHLHIYTLQFPSLDGNNILLPKT